MKFELLTKESKNWDIVKLFAKNSTWTAGRFLANLMDNDYFKDFERVVSVSIDNVIVGYCTITKEDCIKNVSYTPYIGYLYVDENYRGNRISQKLINFACEYLKEIGFNKVYLVSDHINLYEKYGFYVIDEQIAFFGAKEKIYVKELNIYIPEQIKELVKDLKPNLDDIGRSSDKVLMYEDKYILKISTNKEMLKREYEINKILPYAKPILYLEENDYAYYLRTYISGTSLIDNKYLSNPHRLINILVKVINQLQLIDTTNINIYSTDNTGNNFIHGDLCLPNILVDKEDNIAGLIDLANAGIGDMWYDLSWLLWSLEYNLKTNAYNQVLLDKLNIEFNEEKYNLYIPSEYRKDLRGNNNG